MRREDTVLDMYLTGQKIKRIMEDRGYTVRDIQKYLNLSSVQSIYHWIEGRSLPTIDNFYALSDLFQTPVDDMLVGNRKFRSYLCNDKYLRFFMYYEGINCSFCA